ncbi:hypothetical protein Ga0451573_001100 [Peptococcaceae bacterium DYL19]|nr:hypothetical protein [Phosphitispora fastidiosa]
MLAAVIRSKWHLTLLITFVRSIESRPLVIDEFDAKLWTVAVDKVTVTLEGKLIFSFKDGTDIEG